MNRSTKLLIYHYIGVNWIILSMKNIHKYICHRFSCKYFVKNHRWDGYWSVNNQVRFSGYPREKRWKKVNLELSQAWKFEMFSSFWKSLVHDKFIRNLSPCHFDTLARELAENLEGTCWKLYQETTWKIRHFSLIQSNKPNDSVAFRLIITTAAALN